MAVGYKYYNKMQLTYDKVSGILQDKIREYEHKIQAGHYSDFYTMCIAHLSKSLTELNDKMYLNAQLHDQYYVDNPDALIVTPDQYLEQGDLEQALNAAKEIRDMEYKHFVAEEGTIMMIGILAIGFLFGYLIGKKKKSK